MKSCTLAGDQLLNIFDLSTYTGGTFNAGDLGKFGNVFLIKLMTTFDDCSYTTFMIQLNNRLTDYAFLGGLGANIATQVGLMIAG